MSPWPARPAPEGRKIFDTPSSNTFPATSPGRAKYRSEKNRRFHRRDQSRRRLLQPAGTAQQRTPRRLLPLRIEKGNLAEGGDQIRVSLGKVAEAHILRRPEGHAMVVDRGAAALGGPPKIPGKGLALAIAQPQIDADAWRRLFAGDNGGASAGAVPADLPPLQMAVKTPLLRLFGRDFRDVEVNLRPATAAGRSGCPPAKPSATCSGAAAAKAGSRPTSSASPFRPPPPAKAAATAILDSCRAWTSGSPNSPSARSGSGGSNSRARNERSLWNLEALSLQNPDGALKGRPSGTVSAATIPGSASN